MKKLLVITALLAIAASACSKSDEEAEQWEIAKLSEVKVNLHVPRDRTTSHSRISGKLLDYFFVQNLEKLPPIGKRRIIVRCVNSARTGGLFSAMAPLAATFEVGDRVSIVEIRDYLHSPMCNATPILFVPEPEPTEPEEPGGSSRNMGYPIR